MSASRSTRAFQDDSLGNHNHVLHTRRWGGDINFRANAQMYLGIGADGHDLTEYMGGRETRPRNVYVFCAIFAGPHRAEAAIGELWATAHEMMRITAHKRRPYPA